MKLIKIGKLKINLNKALIKCAEKLIRHNVYVYGVVWRFEARTSQTVTKFIKCNALQISTVRQMHYTRCCELRYINLDESSIKI